MYLASITEGDKYLEGRLSERIEFARWRGPVRKDSAVFMKPNFIFPYYKDGITTTPELLKNLLEIIKDRTNNKKLLIRRTLLERGL